MSNFLKKILYILDEGGKKIPIMLIMFLMSSLLDLVGIGMIAPYIALILDPSSMNEVSVYLHWFVDSSNKTDSLLIVISLILIMVFLVKTIVVILINKMIIDFSQNQEVSLRSFLINSYMFFPYTEYLKRNSSEYIYSIHSLAGHFSSQILLPLLKTISDAITVVFILVFLAWTNLSALTLLVVLLGVVIISYDKLFRYKVTLYGRRSNELSTHMIQSIHEGIEGLKEVRILGREKYFINKVVNDAEMFAFYNKKSQLFSIVPRYLLELAMIGFVIITVISTFLLGMDTSALVPTLGVFGVAALRLLPASNNMSSSLVQLRYSQDVINRLYRDLKNIKDCEFSNKSKSIKVVNNSVFKNFVVDNVSFSYDEAKHKALNNVSLDIKAGESIGIMGASGSGKTTLIDMLLGILNADGGRITYNGKPLGAMLGVWQSKIAYLPQQVFLIDDTLKHNVALGVNECDIDEDKLYKSLKKSQLIKTTEKLVKGVNTVLGERGMRLSGGQRQRIALARAFYHNREILIMDEATSALDNETENEIVKEIKQLKGKKTLIVIAHRITTLKHCDRVYELKNGKIINTKQYCDLV